ncbi:MAG: radical SAM protein [Bacteroidetes bacterium]|nr:radical SAM protein [Bacteroidota bacterium]MBS1979141.1 radical SAM protein [Bacteroidota bacterium]
MGLLQRAANLLTNQIYEMPILVLMPHSRCNCRCIMCDIWKANSEKKELSVEYLQQHVDSFSRLGVKHVTLSGGEALMHSNLWSLCQLLKKAGMRMSLLSTGLTLERHVQEINDYFDEVIVSIDGPEEVHNRVRNISDAFERLQRGVRTLKKLNRDFMVSGRCVLQKVNFLEFDNIVMTAHSIPLNRISFLAADVSTSAFSRTEPWIQHKVDEIALSLEETHEFERILENSFLKHHGWYSSGFIAESPAKLRQLVRYYRAFHGQGSFESPACNAPWVSAVIESNGNVLPCFFQPPYGNLNDGLEAVINNRNAIRFRKNLKVKENAICRKCVCSLHRPLF